MGNRIHRDFVKQIIHCSIRYPQYPDEYEDTRDKIFRLLNEQAARYLTDDFQRVSLGAQTGTSPA